MTQLHRYAVLHHTGFEEPHYDVLIEREPGGPLASWRAPAWPLNEGMRLLPRPDHRRLYLDYEGEVSGGRGQVRRVANGTCDVTFGGRLVEIAFARPRLLDVPDVFLLLRDDTSWSMHLSEAHPGSCAAMR